jgi:hypothetical protein
MVANVAVDLKGFVDSLRGTRIGIVYSHRFEDDLQHSWYHRWQTNIIGFFSQAAEHLDAVPVFFDLDQWIQFCARPWGKLDYVVNLNAGNRLLANWAIVPSLASWRRIPVAPCDAPTVLLGEAKDISKILAAANGWQIPKYLEEVTDPTALVVSKPRTFGSSVGLVRLNRSEAQSGDQDIILEEFIPGYDATIVLLYSALSGKLECLGAQAMIPHRDNPTDWMYDSFEKRNPGQRTAVSELLCPVSNELGEAAIRLARAMKSKSVMRIDVRVKSEPSVTTPIRLSDCVFLEANPMPTIGAKNSVTAFAARYVCNNIDHPAISWLSAATKNEIERAAAYILAVFLYAASSK